MTEKKFEDINDKFCLVNSKVFVNFNYIFKQIENAESLNELETILGADLDYIVATFLFRKGE